MHRKAVVRALRREQCRDPLAVPKRRGRSTTLPSALKELVPIRTGPWTDPTPGFGEIDTVVHCGESLVGTLAHPDIPRAIKDDLTAQYATLDPKRLKDEMDRLTKEIFDIERQRRAPPTSSGAR